MSQRDGRPGFGSPGKGSSTQTIGLVARREILSRWQSKAWRYTSLLLIAVIIVMAVVAKFAGGIGTKVTVGVTPEAGSLATSLTSVGDALGMSITVRPVSDEAAGRAEVSDGTLDALLIGASPPLTVIVKSSLNSGLARTLNVLTGNLTTAAEIQKLGGDPAAFQAALAQAKVTVVSLTPPPTYDPQRVFLGILAGVLIFIVLQVNGQFIAQGVVEEKSTRVVELLLATVKPWQLMSGKVLGIGLLGLAQLVVIAGAGLGVSIALGSLTLAVPTAVGAVVWVIVWFVLGFFAYAFALAAAAALVSRQEDVGGVMMPVLSFLIVGYILGVTVVPQNPGSSLVRVMSLLPPFAPTLMPIRQAIGSVPLIDTIVSLALMIASIPLLALLAGRIYRNAVVRTGARIGLREALRNR
jgi:ABC-2 type transport system permease protein